MCAFEPEYASEPRHAPERPCAPEPEYAFQPGYRDPAELLAAAAGCTARRDPRRAELIGRLQRRTDAAAFAAAAEAARSADLALRVVAMEVLGQLGYPADRPYREQTLPILLAEIDQAVEPRLLQTAITATAHLGDGRALAPVLRHAGHRDALVRRAVAFTLPTLVDPAEPAPAVLAALIELSRDAADAEVRDRAVFGLGELLEADTPALRAALTARLGDLPAIAGRAREGLERRGAA
jgi:HEAT repeat protein